MIQTRSNNNNHARTNKAKWCQANQTFFFFNHIDFHENIFVKNETFSQYSKE